MHRIVNFYKFKKRQDVRMFLPEIDTLAYDDDDDDKLQIN